MSESQILQVLLPFIDGQVPECYRFHEKPPRPPGIPPLVKRLSSTAGARGDRCVGFIRKRDALCRNGTAACQVGLFRPGLARVEPLAYLADMTSPAMPRVVVRPLVVDDYPLVKDIIAESFADHIRQNPDGLAEYELEPWYDPAHLLVAEVDGKVVSHMGVRDGVLWIQGRQVKAGLIGTVCTAAGHRGEGIGALLLQASFRWIEERGLEMSYLHTSPERFGFYGRQEYRLAEMDSPQCILSAPSSPPDVNGYRIRQAEATDADSCNRLYEETFGKLTGAWSRTPEFWVRRLTRRPKLWSTGRPEFWVAEADGPVAYLALEGEEPAIPELGGDHGALAALVHHAFQQTGALTLRAPIGRDREVCRDLGPFSPELSTGPGAVMVRVHQEEAFLQVAGEILQERTQAAGVRVTLRTERQTIQAGDSGELLEFTLSIHDLCSLMYNGRRLATLLEMGDVAVEAGDADALRRVFPETFATRCLFDGY